MEIAHVSWSNEFEELNLAGTEVPQIQVPTQKSVENTKHYTRTCCRVGSLIHQVGDSTFNAVTMPCLNPAVSLANMNMFK